MVINTQTLAVPVSVTTGAAMDVSVMGEKTVFIHGTFSATYQVEISDDGTNWESEGTALTAHGTLSVTKPCIKLRLNCTVYTSGTPTAVVCGIYAKRGG